VSEWIGWVGRLKRSLYARLEELRFRTGAAAFAGVLAVAATAILLTLTQGSQRAALTRQAQAGAAPSSAVLAPPAALSPGAHPAHHSRAANAPFADYVPGPTKTPTATPQASPSPTWRAPRHTRLRYRSGLGSPTATSPGLPSWPFPTPSRSQRR
jgi:hypothetical protein